MPEDETEANMQVFIDGLPKAELHVHVEGTLEPELKPIIESQRRNSCRSTSKLTFT
jgi:adenosine deaminase